VESVAKTPAVEGSTELHLWSCVARPLSTHRLADERREGLGWGHGAEERELLAACLRHSSILPRSDSLYWQLLCLRNRSPSDIPRPVLLDCARRPEPVKGAYGVAVAIEQARPLTEPSRSRAEGSYPGTRG